MHETLQLEINTLAPFATLQIFHDAHLRNAFLKLLLLNIEFDELIEVSL